MSASASTPKIGLLVIGDEILSGRRADQHLSKTIELLAARGLSLASAEYIGDDAAQITTTLRRVFASGDVYFSTGGIGATPDDRTRQCAADALDLPLALHPEAKRLIEQRGQALAREKGEPWQPERADNAHRLNMGVYPEGAEIIPNPYNQIPGFSCVGDAGGRVFFMPGFPVMAWPMMQWALDQRLGLDGADRATHDVEHSIIVFGAGEALLTPVMERVEATHPQVKVFSLPSVDHPVYGAHIDLGVKGPTKASAAAFADLKTWLKPFNLRYGPEQRRG